MIAMGPLLAFALLLAQADDSKPSDRAMPVNACVEIHLRVRGDDGLSQSLFANVTRAVASYVPHSTVRCTAYTLYQDGNVLPDGPAGDLGAYRFAISRGIFADPDGAVGHFAGTCNVAAPECGDQIFRRTMQLIGADFRTRSA
jgi:hypothetical protein